MDRLRLLIGSRHWLLLAALALTSLALGTAIFSGASFTSKSANSASLAAGSVQISSSLPNQAIVPVSGWEPGASKQETISISNKGDVAAAVTLSATELAGATLANVITLKVEDVTSGTTKKYEGKLGAFSSVSLGSFAAEATRKYRFTLSWPSASNEASLQGLSTSLTFRWEMANGFTDTAQNPQTVSAVADWVAPSAEVSTVAISESSVPGYAKASSSYFVFAKVTDSGNPPSGIASVKANVSAITSGQTAVPLVAGSYSVGGVSYNYRSAQLTAGSSVSGSKSYTITSTDLNGKASNQGFSATVFKGAFEGSSFATSNVSGGTSGKPEKGDTVSYAFNRAPDPSSIVSNWDGSGTKSVTVTITESGSNDLLTVSGAMLGSVALGADYTESKTLTFSGSTLSLEGSEVTVVLAAASGAAKTVSKSKPTWTPSTSVRDILGEACSSSAVAEGNQKQF